SPARRCGSPAPKTESRGKTGLPSPRCALFGSGIESRADHTHPLSEVDGRGHDVAIRSRRDFLTRRNAPVDRQLIGRCDSGSRYVSNGARAGTPCLCAGRVAIDLVVKALIAGSEAT